VPDFKEPEVVATEQTTPTQFVESVCAGARITGGGSQLELAN
jgi:hypothetical protein